MGNHNSHDKATNEQGGGSGSNSRRGSQKGEASASGSSTEGLQEKPAPLPIIPVDKLVKLLAQRAQKEDGVNGITEHSVSKYLFARYPALARRLFAHVHRASACRTPHVPSGVFRAACERLLAVLDDAAVIETYVRMFSAEEEQDTVTPDCLRQLLLTSYRISMDHYPDGPQTCLMLDNTLSAVVAGCFGAKHSLAVSHVVRWLLDACARLIFPVHRYVVHVITTRHRSLTPPPTPAPEGPPEEGPLSLGAPVLGDGGALAPSAAWLLAGAVPPLYSRPINGGPQTSSALWLARLVCVLPSHWAPLYRSRDQGIGANRFLHHTTGYRGPTLVVIQAEDQTLAIACPQEWREATQYWGTEDCALVCLYPTFSVLERGPKLLYLNTCIRGFPRGLRAGADPRRPTLAVGEDFDTIEVKGRSYQLDAIEVWGCGDVSSRETQLEIKKWQVKEAERQRQVKLSAADWIEHPDRYLLELAGRPQYNNSAS